MDGMTLALVIILIATGLMMLLAELFIPTGGILFAMAIAAIAGGVAIPFFYGDISVGVITLLAVLIIVPTLGRFVLHYWPRTAMGRRLFQTGPEEDATVASMPVNLELESLRGQIGKAVSPLRPAGVVEFNNRRIDCLSEGMLVEPGTWVRCIDVKAGRVIVRVIEEPKLPDLENIDFT